MQRRQSVLNLPQKIRDNNNIRVRLATYYDFDFQIFPSTLNLVIGLRGTCISQPLVTKLILIQWLKHRIFHFRPWMLSCVANKHAVRHSSSTLNILLLAFSDETANPQTNKLSPSTNQSMKYTNASLSEHVLEPNQTTWQHVHRCLSIACLGINF